MAVTRVVRGDDPAAIAEAASLLRRGELVAFPTETVYGLGCDARSESAVARVFEVKGRPADNPLIVHVADVAQVDAVASDIPRDVGVLAQAFWPGPLTLVLRSRPGIAATRGLDTVAVRVPDHPVALALLREAAIPLAAPSANLSGRPSPTRAQDVVADLGGLIPLVLDGGACRVGIESTVLDLTGSAPAILRPGSIDAAALGAALGRPVTGVGEGDALKRSPGTRHRHYAPRARLLLLGRSVTAGAIAALVERLGRCAYAGSRPDLRAVGELELADAPTAATLYALLRDLDARELEAILIDEPEPGALGDRLRRGASAVLPDDGSVDSIS